MRVAYALGKPTRKGGDNESSNAFDNKSFNAFNAFYNEPSNAFNDDRRRNGSSRLVKPLDHEHRGARVLDQYQPAGHARLSVFRRRDGAEALRAPDA
jgi:hypothetical protein